MSSPIQAESYPEISLLIGDLAVREARTLEDVINPATGQSVGGVPHATAQDIEAALEEARLSFDTWRKVTSRERGLVLRRAASLMRERSEVMATAMTLEQGKPLGEARGEVAYAADVFDWYAEEARRSYGRVIPSRMPGLRQLVVKEPAGPVVAFTPWNFPALTPARKIAACLAAGCSMILKPAEETPATAFLMAEALRDVGLPAGVLNIIYGVPAEISETLIGDDRISRVSFTGSPGVGRLLASLAGMHGKRITLELGGHAPVIITEDVEIEAVARQCVEAKFRNSGQVCIAPTRFFIQSKVFDTFVRAFVDRTQSVRMGDGMSNADMGPLANARRRDAVQELVKDAIASGAKLETGGSIPSGEGYYYPPTVLRNVPVSSRIMSEEPFGPVAPLTSFETLDEAISLANSLPYGLAAYAFTNSDRTRARLGNEIRAGMVGLNTFAVSHPETPFGGVKASGYGHEGGTEGMDEFLDVKFIAEG